MNSRKLILTLGGLLLASTLMISLSANALAANDFSMIVTPPKERIVSVGSTEEIEITIKNESDNTTDYEFNLSVSKTRGAVKEWDAEIEDNPLTNVAPNESRVTYLSVTVPENAVDYSQNEITVTLTNSQGKSVSDDVIIGARPESVYNTQYLITGVAVVIIGIIVVIIRWSGII